jgi:putative sporulation protein YyaC
MNPIVKSNYVNSASPFAVNNFSNLIFNYLIDKVNVDRELLILCIGTDRSTGDALGPLVGHKLSSVLSNYKNVHLLGTLDSPVHAQNLEKIIDNLNDDYKDPFIIAVDASLGRQDKIGYVCIKNSSLKPGAGVNKNLPAVGDISITGVVNIGGMMEYMVLQNTRLSIVMSMAEIISKSIHSALFRFYAEKDKEYTY